MKKLNLSLILFLLSAGLNAQISGVITDRVSREGLAGAHVLVYSPNGLTVLEKTISGKSGEFSLDRKASKGMKLVVSFVGYQLYEQLLEEGEDYKNLQIFAEPSRISVGEVTVNAFRQDRQLKNLSMPLSVLNSGDIQKSPGITASDLLSGEPGLALSRDGIWATSLTIRGLSEQRIVTLVDGNRVETATDIAAGMAMTDINDIERIEVIKGAASSIYGTGALGGVVNIITKSGHYNQNFQAEGNAGLSYQSVNNMHSEHAAVQMGDKKWFLRLSGTYRDAQNTKTPDGDLENSQFRDNNLSLKAGVKTLENHELRLNLQRYQAKDVGIPGGKSFPAAATATYPEEKRELANISYSIKGEGDIIKELSVRYFYQFILRDVELIPNQNTSIRPSGYHTTQGGLIQMNLNPLSNHSMITGIDIWQRNLRTERFKDIYQPIKDEEGAITGTNHIFRAEIPIPETDFRSAGFFLQDEFLAFNDRLKVDIGGRYDIINVQNDEAVDPLYLIINDNRNDNPPNQRITFPEKNVNNHSWSANLGLLYYLSPDLNLTASLSRAFRSPSIEERYKYIDLGSIVSIGDPELKPEDGYFADLGFKIWKQNLHLSVNAFVNTMSNLIVALPGETVYNYADQPERTDTLPALINANVDKALLYGYDLSFAWNFNRGTVLFGSSSFVRGVNTMDDTDLPLIPPLNGRLGIRHTTGGGYGVELSTNLFADQDKIAEGEKETKGFATYDLKFYTRTLNVGNIRLTFYGGIENIGDRAYLNHLSTNRGLVKLEPGRNFYLRMSAAF